MLIYWAVFVSFALLAITKVRVSTLGWFLIGAVLTLFIGLRYEVGGDWFSYLGYLDRVAGLGVLQALVLKDPGYQFINWLASSLELEVWFVNTFSAAVFVFGLIKFIRVLPDPLLALVVAIPYMTIVMAMGYTRQAVAFGFVLWGLTKLLDRKLVSFMVILAVAALFHKSAIVLVPLAVLANTRGKLWTYVWIGVSGIVLFFLLLAEHVDVLWQNYVTDDYSQSSEGGPIRVAMNALPAILCLFLHKRLDVPSEQRALWFWVSAFSIASSPLVFMAPTAVDRIALYFMPIQLVLFSYLSQIVVARDRVIARIVVVAFYGVVLFVWLNFAGHREAWIPYRFWPTA